MHIQEDKKGERNNRPLRTKVSTKEFSKYDIDPDRIERGEDFRTTVMVRNVAGANARKEFLNFLEKCGLSERFTFFYMPCKEHRNVLAGFAFVNFVAPTMIGNLAALTVCLQEVMTAPYEDAPGVNKDHMNSFVKNVIYSKIIAGMCVTMIFGNTYYAWMAYRMMQKEKTTNVCTLPYGINTPAAFAFVFSVVAKAAQEGASQGMGMEEGVLYAWKVGCVANVVSGLIATMCGFAGPLIVKVAPAGSLMVALAGLGFTYLGIGQIISCFDVGHLGLLPLGVALAGFFGEVRTSPLPAAVAVMLVGSLTGWLSFEGWPEGENPTGGTPEAVQEAMQGFSFYMPQMLSPSAFAQIPEVAANNLAVILPVAFVGAVNTLVSTYSAHSAGDMFSIRECLIVDGLTTVVAGLFGSPFGTCVYCGHPQFKNQGGKIYYSFLNCILFCFLAATGMFAAANAVLPPWATAPIILFIGLSINQDAFNIIHNRHIPAAIIGLFPSTADWIMSIDSGVKEKKPGLAALSYGALLVCVIWTSMGIHVIDRRFMQAGIWAIVGAVLAAPGLIHQEKADLSFKNYMGGPEQPFGLSACAFQVGYASLALLFFLLKIPQHYGSSRVPAEIKDKEEDAEVEAEEMAQRANERSSSRIISHFFDNAAVEPDTQHSDSDSAATSDLEDRHLRA
ncbi:unnamed protein product [Effrenium voratum]|nr:unnamed protein product [Effrenium voratum]